jgi:hypothetical protein
MSDLAGEEYGIAPLKDHTSIQLPIDSRDLVSPISYRDGSEFGGVAGLIQPPPHVPTASERMMMIRAIDPMDDGTRSDSVLAPELEGDFT